MSLLWFRHRVGVSSLFSIHLRTIRKLDQSEPVPKRENVNPTSREMNALKEAKEERGAKVALCGKATHGNRPLTTLYSAPYGPTTVVPVRSRLRSSYDSSADAKRNPTN